MAKPSSNLPRLVHEKFNKAKDDGSLTYYQTQVSVLKCNNLTVSWAVYKGTLAQLCRRILTPVKSVPTTIFPCIGP